MRFRVLFFFIVTLFCKATFSQINITLDYSNAALTFEILEKKEAKLIDSLLSLETTKRLIAKAARFNDKINTETYKKELKAALKESFTKEDVLRFKRVTDRLDKIKLIYEYVLNNKQELTSYLNASLGKFLKPKVQLNITGYLLLGGTSDGFSDGKNFSLDIGFYDDDIEGVKLIFLHEMFHIVQSKLYPKNKVYEESLTEKELQQFSIIKYLFKEGTASYIANPLKIKDHKSYLKWFSRKYKNNLRRTQQNFDLFESK